MFGFPSKSKTGGFHSGFLLPKKRTGRIFTIPTNTYSTAWSITASSVSCIDTDGQFLYIGYSVTSGVGIRKVNAIDGTDVWTIDTTVNVYALKVDNKFVYVAYSSGANNLACYQKSNGQLVWTAPIKMYAYGMDMDSDYIYIANYGLSNADMAIWKYRKADGSVIWSKNDLVDVYDVKVDSSYVYVSYGFYGVRCLDINDGHEIWRNTDINAVAKLSVDANYLYCAYSYGVSENCYVIKRNKMTGAVIWTVSDRNFFPYYDLLSKNGLLYVATLNNLQCLQADNGAQVWAKSDKSPVSGAYGDGLTVNDTCLFVVYTASVDKLVIDSYVRR